MNEQTQTQLPDEHFDVLVELIGKELYMLHEKHDAREAIRKAIRMSMGGAARMGLLTRIVLVDMKSRVAFDWRSDKGVVFPPELHDALADAQAGMRAAIEKANRGG